MKFVADVHIHSHYSRATSKNLNFEHLTQWAQLKGIHVVGTGDIAHPGWLQEMKEKLEPAEEGLFRLKDEVAQTVQANVPAACRAAVRFMLAGEISSIYKKNDKVRKIHNVIFAPSLGAVEKIQAALEKIGNIRSDGRPILGLDSRDLLEIILNIDAQNYLIPAHIWTPWFSLFGSKSGFDSVEECFEDLTPHIFALETGLSSDPPMNWRVSALDGYTLVSNSDAHSPQKLAREANVFNTELSYPAFFDALKTGDPEKFLGTLEFFPEEGKYHHDGHRKCGISWTPKTTLEHNGLCPVCGKPVTVGVSHRVETLADREEGERPARRHPFQSLIPLPELLGEIHGVGSTSKRVALEYDTLLAKLGSELTILLDVPLDDIRQAGGPLLAEGIGRMRSGEVITTAGFDGEYGVIKVFDEGERDSFSAQLSFFPAPARKKTEKSIPADSKPGQPPTEMSQAALFDKPDLKEIQLSGQPSESFELLSSLNPQQQEAVRCTDVPLIIVAGPGTGKTRTLTYRIAYLIKEQGITPENILAITFTNKAAAEMAHRLKNVLGAEVARHITIKTFHAFGAMILRESGSMIGFNPHFSICSEQERKTLLKQLQPDWGDKEINQRLEQISEAKNQLLPPESRETADQFDAEFIKIYRRYQAVLQKNQLLDFDDLITQTVYLFQTRPEALAQYQRRFRWLSVDEYQDINLAQYQLLRLLTPPGTNLCAIGDPDQAIYGFRGADRTYFMKFQEDFPHAKILHLSRNYRSTQLILDASSQVIEKSPAQERVKIWSDFVDKTRIDVHRSPTDKAEAEYTVHEIEKMVGGTSYFSIDSGRLDDDTIKNRTFADFAVLYRLNAQSHLLAEAFDRSGIPYQIVGQTPLVEVKEIQHVLAYLWFTTNPNSGYHLEKIVNQKKTMFTLQDLDNLQKFAIEQNTSLADVLPQSKQMDFLTAAQQKRLANVAPLCHELAEAAKSQAVADLIDIVRKNLNQKQSERLERFALSAAPFDHRLTDFLESTLLQRETDNYDPQADRVTLMTLHAAKGLEFPVVFMVGCEENLLPYELGDKIFDLEEERRLFYVGMTRAQQKLILTHAGTRFLFGQRWENQPSPFVNDIENTLKELKKTARQKKVKKDEDPATQLSLF